MPTAIGAYTTTARLKSKAGITDSTDDTVLGTIADEVNGFLESPYGCGRVIAPISSATYLLDGEGGRWLYFPKGIRAITELKIGDYTGDTLDILATTDYFIRPLAQDRTPGWPAFYVLLSDLPAGDHSVFHEGIENVSMTCTAGWAAIPDDLSGLADRTAIRTWHGVQAGQTDVVGVDEMGAPIVSRYVAPGDWGLIKAYRIKQPQVIG